MTEATGAPSGPPPFAWHDREALAGLFGPHGFEVAVQQQSISFTAPSPLEYLVRDYSSHPLAVAGREILEPRGKLEALHARTLETLEAANEDRASFRVTSDYVIATAWRTRTEAHSSITAT